MRAAVFHEFGGNIAVETIADPVCPNDGVVVAVKANGVCRSDWHGWMGHDRAISLPHVPGHELAGVVAAVGPDCRHWRVGQRVTAPFVLACGRCMLCRDGQHQICLDQAQPGFTAWGAFADYVAVPRADTNLIALPEAMDFAAAASLGCRFTTAFRAVVERGRLRAGEWLAVHGCGGVGLSAVMIGVAAGANVVAVDINPEALATARALGAAVTIDARAESDVPAAVASASNGGAQVSVDALGHRDTCRSSILCLRSQGRHVQAGLLEGEQADPPLPMGAVIGRELEILGTHGMAAHRFPQLFEMIATGRLSPERLIGRRIPLEDAPAALMGMAETREAGLTVIDFDL